jgi:hypothetical protein
LRLIDENSTGHVFTLAVSVVAESMYKPERKFGREYHDGIGDRTTLIYSIEE